MARAPNLRRCGVLRGSLHRRGHRRRDSCRLPLPPPPPPPLRLLPLLRVQLLLMSLLLVLMVLPRLLLLLVLLPLVPRHLLPFLLLVPPLQLSHLHRHCLDALERTAARLAVAAAMKTSGRHLDRCRHRRP